MTDQPIRETIPGRAPEPDKPGPDPGVVAGSAGSPERRDLHFFLDEGRPQRRLRAVSRSTVSMGAGGFWDRTMVISSNDGHA